MKTLSTLATAASTKIQDENGDDYAIVKNADAGRKIWIQASDPSGSATNGDVWFQIP